MFDVMTIFQRTTRGLAEIRNKTHELTQSERLVLIIVDGVTPCEGLRDKLKGLADARFERALQTLLDKGLIAERDFSVDGMPTESLDLGVVDRFLQQAPLDPVTLAAQDYSGNTLAHEQDPGRAEERASRSPGMTRVDIYLPLEPLPRVPVLQQEQMRPLALVLDQRADELPHQSIARKPMPLWGCWILFFGMIAAMLVVVLTSS